MNTKRDLLISKGWMQTVGIVGLCGFLSLGILAYRTYTDEPPIPSHSMSHRLHSLKLDTLGLAAAAKSFCCELAERQDVEVKFNSEKVPRKLPEAISLCLFRVLQEALQNAVKHSGVRHFRVSLVGSTNQIALTVCDGGFALRKWAERWAGPDQHEGAPQLSRRKVRDRCEA